MHSDKDTRKHRHTYTLRSLDLACNMGSKYQRRALSLWHHLTNIEGNSGGCLLLCPFPPRSCSTPPWPGWTSCWQELIIAILVFVILNSLFILIFFWSLPSGSWQNGPWTHLTKRWTWLWMLWSLQNWGKTFGSGIEPVTKLNFYEQQRVNQIKETNYLTVNCVNDEDHFLILHNQFTQSQWYPNSITAWLTLGAPS